jgi:hypothetical protein
MTINDSRLKNGSLKLGVVGTGEMDMSCQITNARVTTAYSDDGDALTTLCGDTKPAPRKLDGHKLEGTIVQDFDLDEVSGGIIDYLWNHNLEVVEFTYLPNDLATCPTLTGTLQIEIPSDTYGGDVGTRTTADFSWSIQGTLLRTYPAGGVVETAASKTPAVSAA